MLPDLVEIAPTLEARSVGVRQHQRGPPRALRGIGLGDDDDNIGILPIGDVSLGPVDDQMVAIFDRSRANALQIAPGPRFRHGNCGNDVARHHARQILGALFIRAEAFDIIGGDVVLKGKAGRTAEIGQLLAQHTIEAEIETQAAILFLDGRAQHPRLAQGLPC